MVTQASAEAEPHVIWTRPLEVGFEMGRYIEGESTTKRLFGCVCGGRSSKTEHFDADDGGRNELSTGAEIGCSQSRSKQQC